MLGVKCCRFSGEFLVIHPLRLFPVYVKLRRLDLHHDDVDFCPFQKQREDQTGLQ